MDDDMATPIDQLPGPQQVSQQLPQQLPQQFPQQVTQQLPQQVTQQVTQQPEETKPRVKFDETPTEITNVTMDVKKKNTENKKEVFSIKSLLSKKTLYESIVLVGLYVLLSQPYVVYKLGDLIGSRFGSNITMQLVVRGLLLVVVYYILSIFVLPKLN